MPSLFGLVTNLVLAVEGQSEMELTREVRVGVLRVGNVDPSVWDVLDKSEAPLHAQNRCSYPNPKPKNPNKSQSHDK